MPRSTQSPLGRVLAYVRTTSLEVLEETFPLIQDIVRERRAKSVAAKKLARKGPATDAPAAATSATAAAPKRKGPKPGTKRRKAPTAVAETDNGAAVPSGTEAIEEYGEPESELAPV